MRTLFITLTYPVLLLGDHIYCIALHNYGLSQCMISEGICDATDIVSTLSQPCYNHVTTMFTTLLQPCLQPCYNHVYNLVTTLFTTLLQPCYNLVCNLVTTLLHLYSNHVLVC